MNEIKSNLRNVHYKTVSAGSADALDTALEEARAEIIAINRDAEWIGLELTATADACFATIIWS